MVLKWASSADCARRNPRKSWLRSVVDSCSLPQMMDTNCWRHKEDRKNCPSDNSDSIEKLKTVRARCRRNYLAHKKPARQFGHARIQKQAGTSKPADNARQMPEELPQPGNTGPRQGLQRFDKKQMRLQCAFERASAAFLNDMRGRRINGTEGACAGRCPTDSHSPPRLDAGRAVAIRYFEQ